MKRFVSQKMSQTIIEKQETLPSMKQYFIMKEVKLSENK